MAQTSVVSQKAVISLERTVSFGPSRLPITIGTDRSIANGTSAGQCDLVYALDDQSIAASGTLDIDLSGSLTDPLGASVVFAKVDAIILVASASNTNNVVIGAAASNQFVGPFGAATHTIAVRPGGEITLWASGAGWSVTAGTADILRLANSGAGSAVVFDLVILGRSA